MWLSGCHYICRYFLFVYVAQGFENISAPFSMSYTTVALFTF